MFKRSDPHAGLSKAEKDTLKYIIRIENENKVGINQFIKVGLFLILSLTIEVATFLLVGFKSPTSGHSQILPDYIFFDFGFWLILCSFMLTCSNGHYGYIPTEFAFPHKGYEVNVCLFVPGTAEQFVAKYIEMLTEMKNK